MRGETSSIVCDVDITCDVPLSCTHVTLCERTCRANDGCRALKKGRFSPELTDNNNNVDLPGCRAATATGLDEPPVKDVCRPRGVMRNPGRSIRSLKDP